MRPLRWILIKSEAVPGMPKYRLKFLPEALDEWNNLDGSVKEVLRKALKKRIEQPHARFEARNQATRFRLVAVPLPLFASFGLPPSRVDLIRHVLRRDARQQIIQI